MTSLISEVLQALTIALPLFLIGVLSPGPATMAIMLLSAKLGRRSGLLFAFGVSVGSLFWGTVAALGLSSFLQTYAEFTIGLRIAGGIYLLWMAFKSLRSSFQGHALSSTSCPQRRNWSGLIYSGLMLHLFNPKAIFVWLAVVSIGLGDSIEPSVIVAQSTVLVCWSFSLLAFTCYAVIFSSDPVVSVYRKCARLIDGICGGLFAAAGLKVLSGR